MSDFLLELASHPLGARLIKTLGLPKPITLARVNGGILAPPLQGKMALLAGAAGGYAEECLHAALLRAGATVAKVDSDDVVQRLDILVFDATGCTSPAALRALYEGFHAQMRRLARNARILIVANEPSRAADPVAAASARAIEGFMRSLAKEVGRQGVCVNLAYAPQDALGQLGGLLGFFVGERASYVTGQAVHVDNRVAAPIVSTQIQPLAGKVALVTGAARGIGQAIVQRLAEDGARLVCLDVDTARDPLYETAARWNGLPLVVDVASAGAGAVLTKFLMQKTQGVDIVVHNAGITRDKTLANMKPAHWDRVMAVNFAAIVAIDEALQQGGVLHDDGRVVCLSSISGVAGNYGQSNYAASKAALIGYVAARAPMLAERGIAINAVAPGFIETPMTQKIPPLAREIGRRINSLSQAGQPRDVAELVCFLASPAASGITGNTLRVCGQAMMGA